MRESELLFPSRSGGYRAPSCLDKPIEDTAEKAEIAKAITPRFMRRTFQDLGRSAQVHDFVVRAISGHATTSMQEHYSSVSGDEVRSGLGKVVALILTRPQAQETDPEQAGEVDTTEIRAAS